MIALVGVVLGLVLLYGWLVAQWFARVLMFLVLAGLGVVIGSSVAPMPAAFGFEIAGVAVAWFLAALPTYYWRHQNRLFAERSLRRV